MRRRSYRFERERTSTPYGNAHYNARRPNGPECECGALWAPVCPTPGCPGRTVPQHVMRVERGGGSRIFPGHPKLINAERSRKGDSGVTDS